MTASPEKVALSVFFPIKLVMPCSCGHGPYDHTFEIGRPAFYAISCKLCKKLCHTGD